MVKRAKKPRQAKKPRGLDTIKSAPGDLLDAGPEGEDEFAPVRRAFAPDWRTRETGYPRRPDDEVKGSRYGLRLHVDLRTELDRLAARDGLLLSVWLQHQLVRLVNDRYGHEVLNLFGRYTKKP